MADEGLRLHAVDAEDLTVVSAHCQDAILAVGDMRFEPAAHRFVLVMNRFAWEKADRERAKRFERRRTALHFDCVEAVRSHRIRREAPDAVLELLAVAFAETEAPAGTVSLVFAGGGEIRLDVECIEVQLTDLGPAWETPNRPSHVDDGSPEAS